MNLTVNNPDTPSDSSHRQRFINPSSRITSLLNRLNAVNYNSYSPNIKNNYIKSNTAAIQQQQYQSNNNNNHNINNVSTPNKSSENFHNISSANGTLNPHHIQYNRSNLEPNISLSFTSPQINDSHTKATTVSNPSNGSDLFLHQLQREIQADTQRNNTTNHDIYNNNNNNNNNNNSNNNTYGLSSSVTRSSHAFNNFDIQLSQFVNRLLELETKFEKQEQVLAENITINSSSRSHNHEKVNLDRYEEIMGKLHSMDQNWTDWNSRLGRLETKVSSELEIMQNSYTKQLNQFNELQSTVNQQSKQIESLTDNVSKSVERLQNLEEKITSLAGFDEEINQLKLEISGIRTRTLEVNELFAEAFENTNKNVENLSTAAAAQTHSISSIQHQLNGTTEVASRSLTLIEKLEAKQSSQQQNYQDLLVIMNELKDKTTVLNENENKINQRIQLNIELLAEEIREVKARLLSTLKIINKQTSEQFQTAQFQQNQQLQNQLHEQQQQLFQSQLHQPQNVESSNGNISAQQHPAPHQSQSQSQPQAQSQQPQPQQVQAISFNPSASAGLTLAALPVVSTPVAQNHINNSGLNTTALPISSLYSPAAMLFPPQSTSATSSSQLSNFNVFNNSQTTPVANRSAYIQQQLQAKLAQAQQQQQKQYLNPLQQAPSFSLTSAALQTHQPISYHNASQADPYFLQQPLNGTTNNSVLSSSLYRR